MLSRASVGRRAALHQPTHQQGERITAKGDQHQGGIEPQQDADSDAQQRRVAQGIAKEGELAQHGKTAQQAAEGAGEQATEEGPLHERQLQQLQEGGGFAHQEDGLAWRWWYGTKPRP